MGADIPGQGSSVSRGDDELLAGARRGDAAALETLLVRYQPHLYRFGLRMCGNADDASDVAQESLMAMARSVRDFRGDASVASWLYTIISRLCIRKRRRSKFAPAHEESLDALRKYRSSSASLTPRPIPNEPSPVVESRRRSPRPSTTSTLDSGRCSFFATSKACPRRKWHRCWASAWTP